jgi:hypothetical protein
MSDRNQGYTQSHPFDGFWNNQLPFYQDELDMVFAVNGDLLPSLVSALHFSQQERKFVINACPELAP